MTERTDHRSAHGAHGTPADHRGAHHGDPPDGDPPPANARGHPPGHGAAPRAAAEVQDTQEQRGAAATHGHPDAAHGGHGQTADAGHDDHGWDGPPPGQGDVSVAKLTGPPEGEPPECARPRGSRVLRLEKVSAAHRSAAALEITENGRCEGSSR